MNPGTRERLPKNIAADMLATSIFKTTAFKAAHESPGRFWGLLHSLGVETTSIITDGMDSPEMQRDATY